MRQTHLIAVPCKIFQGVVPDERAFEITLIGGTNHCGVRRSTISGTKKAGD